VKHVRERCIDIERIGDVLALPGDHPDRRHADSCPRCKSLAVLYREFITAEGLPDSGVEAARPVLDARIRKDAAQWMPARTPAPPSSRTSGWFVLRRPVLLVAAAAIFIAGVTWWSSRVPEEDMLRDSAPPSASFSLHEARVLAGGDIQLSWDAQAGVDQYQVRIYGPDMTAVYQSPLVSESTLTVPRSDLPADLPPTLDLSWQVYTFAQGDEIGSSALGSIRTP
jgi:hypothetical protein